jgi:hypothetical protein
MRRLKVEWLSFCAAAAVGAVFAKGHYDLVIERFFKMLMLFFNVIFKTPL